MNQNRQRLSEQKLSMRVPSDLVEFLREYAVDRHTTMTQVVVDFLVALRESQCPKQH